jgi:hypothetical protein
MGPEPGFRLQPVYFPRTFLHPSTEAAIRALFPSLAVYQPLAGLRTAAAPLASQDGFVEVVSPDPALEDLRPAGAIVRELEDWGRRQHGGAGASPVWWHFRRTADPSRDDGIASELSSAIRGRLSAGASEADARLLEAVVFLGIAHSFDLQRWEAEERLQQVESDTAALFAALTGEERPGAAAPAFSAQRGPADPSERLLKRRLEAWARLFLSRPYPSPVFVTDPGLLMDPLPEAWPSPLRLASGGERVAGPAGVSPAAAPADELIRRLGVIAGLPPPALMEAGVDAPADVYLFPDVSPLRFFSALLPGGVSGCGPQQGCPWRHTIVVQLG